MREQGEILRKDPKSLRENLSCKNAIFFDHSGMGERCYSLGHHC